MSTYTLTPQYPKPYFQVAAPTYAIAPALIRASCPNAPPMENAAVNMAPFMEWKEVTEAMEHPIYGCEAQKKSTVSVMKPGPSALEAGEQVDAR